MRELNSARKIKINLSDYDFKRDTDNRLLMAEFSAFDREVLEEILYSSIQIDLEKLIKNLKTDEKKLLQCLKKLSKTNLFEFKNDKIIVDKQMRKYFESEILKFDEDFKPDFEFLQGLLKKVPIHILPIWYSISRSTNNIFESIVEKYLISPQVFWRHVEEFQSRDPVIEYLIKTLYKPPFKLLSEKVKEKFKISQEELESYLLTLEFGFIGCLSYDYIDGFWKEVITPFHEWKEYLEFLSDTECKSIKDKALVKRSRENDFAFVEDLQTALNFIKKSPLALQDKKNLVLSPEKTKELIKKLNLEKESTEYLKNIFEKLLTLKFVNQKDGLLSYSDSADEWLSLSLENKALSIYQHPLNHLGDAFSNEIFSENFIRKAEKSIIRALNAEWVYFDDFMKGVICPITDDQNIVLKKEGKNYRYVLPTYSEDQLLLIKTVVLKWLFEAGMVATGTHKDKICFKVTNFGKKFFEV